MNLGSLYLEKLNFALVHIPEGTKAPTSQGWQENPVRTPDVARKVWAKGGNIGLHHGASGTAVLDIDHNEYAALALAAVDIDLKALLNAPGPKIRTPKGLKPIFRLPEGVTLSRKALAWKSPDGKSVSVLELRAGAVQDLLPPSLHPNGQRYIWEGEVPQGRDNIPELPGSLLALWQNWQVLKPTLEKASPWTPAPAPRTYQGDGGGVIGAYNERYSVREVLEANGYTPKGNRYLAPSSSTNIPGVNILKGEDGHELAFSHHGSDPLADGHSHDAFSVYCALEHGGDVKAAVKAAAKELGITYEPKENVAAEATATGRTEEKEPRRSQATELVELVLASNAELFHDPDDEAYITAAVASHFETYRLKSKDARAWLRRLYREGTSKSIGGQAMQDALNDLEGTALFDGQKHQVYKRIAPYKDDIIIDLGDDSHRVIRVTPSGWHLEAYSPVKFVRSKALAPLPVPVAGGSLDELWSLLNVNEEDRVLLAAWLAKALTPEGPYPLLPLHGEQGSAKSTTARAIRALIDPSTAPLRSEPRNPHDLMIAATSAWVPTFDNLSSVSQELSDALCILSTGGGYATRTLYTDDEETILKAQRPVIMTAISDIATRPDLLDRCIILYLPRITDAKRKSEREFWAAFDKAHGRILGALLTAVSTGLAKAPHVHLDELPRMADFAVWAVACEEALGFAPGSFMARYNEVRRDANELALDTSPLPPVLRAFTEHSGGSWQGNASELLNALNDYLKDIQDERTPKAREWPKRPDKLSNALRRYSPNLRATGLEVDFERTKKQRFISLRTVEKSGVTSVTGVTPAEKQRPAQHLTGDATGDAKNPSSVTRQTSVTFGVTPETPSVTAQTPMGDAGDADDAKKRVSPKWEGLEL